MLGEIKHDVKPRVLLRVFSRAFENACAQTSKLSASNPVRKKHRLFAGTPAFDPGKAGRKSRSECALPSKCRGRGILSQPADAGTVEIRVALRLGRTLCRLRQSAEQNGMTHTTKSENVAAKCSKTSILVFTMQKQKNLLVFLAENERFF